MIGKTALALAAAMLIASSTALFVGAAGYALFLVLQPLIIPAGAAASVAGGALLLSLVAIGVARLQHLSKREPQGLEHPAHPMITRFAAAMKQRPLLLIGLTGLAGLASRRNLDLLRSIVSAIIPARTV